MNQPEKQTDEPRPSASFPTTIDDVVQRNLAAIDSLGINNAYLVFLEKSLKSAYQQASDKSSLDPLKDWYLARAKQIKANGSETPADRERSLDGHVEEKLIFSVFLMFREANILFIQQELDKLSSVRANHQEQIRSLKSNPASDNSNLRAAVSFLEDQITEVGEALDVAEKSLRELMLMVLPYYLAGFGAEGTSPHQNEDLKTFVSRVFSNFGEGSVNAVTEDFRTKLMDEKTNDKAARKVREIIQSEALAFPVIADEIKVLTDTIPLALEAFLNGELDREKITGLELLVSKQITGEPTARLAKIIQILDDSRFSKYRDRQRLLLWLLQNTNLSIPEGLNLPTAYDDTATYKSNLRQLVKLDIFAALDNPDNPKILQELTMILGTPLTRMGNNTALNQLKMLVQDYKTLSEEKRALQHEDELRKKLVVADKLIQKFLNTPVPKLEVQRGRVVSSGRLSTSVEVPEGFCERLLSGRINREDSALLELIQSRFAESGLAAVTNWLLDRVRPSDSWHWSYNLNLVSEENPISFLFSFVRGQIKFSHPELPGYIVNDFELLAQLALREERCKQDLDTAYQNKDSFQEGLAQLEQVYSIFSKLKAQLDELNIHTSESGSWFLSTRSDYRFPLASANFSPTRLSFLLLQSVVSIKTLSEISTHLEHLKNSDYDPVGPIYQRLHSDLVRALESYNSSIEQNLLRSHETLRTLKAEKDSLVQRLASLREILDSLEIANDKDVSINNFVDWLFNSANQFDSVLHGVDSLNLEQANANDIKQWLITKSETISQRSETDSYLVSEKPRLELTVRYEDKYMFIGIAGLVADPKLFTNLLAVDKQGKCYKISPSALHDYDQQQANNIQKVREAVAEQVIAEIKKTYDQRNT